MMIIDYEYSSYNYRGFDMGNHFCEWMMNNIYDQFPYFKCNPSLYPNREQQLTFIRSYIKHYRLITSKRKVKLDESLLDEEKMLLEVNCFALASHFFWSVWSICQEACTKITFSYLVSLEL